MQLRTVFLMVVLVALLSGCGDDDATSTPDAGPPLVQRGLVFASPADFRCTTGRVELRATEGLLESDTTLRMNLVDQTTGTEREEDFSCDDGVTSGSDISICLADLIACTQYEIIVSFAAAALDGGTYRFAVGFDTLNCQRPNGLPCMVDGGAEDAAADATKP